MRKKIDPELAPMYEALYDRLSHGASVFCLHCGTEIKLDDKESPVPINAGRDWNHRECMIHAVAGSVGHQKAKAEGKWCGDWCLEGESGTIRENAIRAFRYYIEHPID